MSGFRKDAAYQEIKDYVKEQTGGFGFGRRMEKVQRKYIEDGGHYYDVH